MRRCQRSSFIFFFFFNDTATTEIYTLSLHDALPISWRPLRRSARSAASSSTPPRWRPMKARSRSEEHTSELQSQSNLVCRLLLEKKKKKRNPRIDFVQAGRSLVDQHCCRSSLEHLQD